jgi:hypothetical protein
VCELSDLLRGSEYSSVVMLKAVCSASKRSSRVDRLVLCVPTEAVPTRVTNLCTSSSKVRGVSSCLEETV